jgi:type IV secretory pathway protease TraF
MGQKTKESWLITDKGKVFFCPPKYAVLLKSPKNLLLKEGSLLGHSEAWPGYEVQLVPKLKISGATLQSLHMFLQYAKGRLYLRFTITVSLYSSAHCVPQTEQLYTMFSILKPVNILGQVTFAIMENSY